MYKVNKVQSQTCDSGDDFVRGKNIYIFDTHGEGLRRRRGLLVSTYNTLTEEYKSTLSHASCIDSNNKTSLLTSSTGYRPPRDAKVRFHARDEQTVRHCGVCPPTPSYALIVHMEEMYLYIPGEYIILIRPIRYIHLLHGSSQRCGTLRPLVHFNN